MKHAPKYIIALIVLASACLTGAPLRLAGGTTVSQDAGTSSDGGTSRLATERNALIAGAPLPLGPLPPGFTDRLNIGLTEGNGQTWMRSTGVPFHWRYRYLVKGWVNNWGYGGTTGSFALNYMRECDAQGFKPALQFYQVRGEAPAGESNFYTKTRSAATMRTYFNDFKVLMQRAREFGKPVLVLLEADGFAYMQQQSGNNNQAYAAVAASGLPELAGLPNTVAGWGLAFLRMREAVGAHNVILGIHISAWTTGTDVMAWSGITANLATHVAEGYKFMAPLGLAPNVTGKTYDVLVGDPLDRDADYHKIVNKQDRWWSLEGGINTLSAARYAEWLRLWNRASGKRWVLWQIPLGNSYSRNVRADGTPRSGYRDNRVEYFFEGELAQRHRDLFESAGVIALLFGEGATGQSTARTATWYDGKSLFAERVRSYLAQPAISLSGSGTFTTIVEPIDAGVASCTCPCPCR